MIFAYIVCIVFGLIIGSLQIVRRSVLSALGWLAIIPLYDDGTFESGQAFLLTLLGLPVLAAIFYANPWVIVDNFVAGREALLVVQFSVFKLVTFLVFLCIGEWAAVHYHDYEFRKKRSQYKNYTPSKPEIKFDPDMKSWRNWRRAYANSGHPDWVPPGTSSKNHNTSENIYVDPMRHQALQTLGLKSGASSKEVHRQYLKLAKRNHPDKVLQTGADSIAIERAEEKMAEINAAYDWLKDNP